MLHRFLLLVLVPALLCTWGYGQSYSFLSYSIAEGLPQSQVTSITEDEEGYLWVGTLGGLGRFNGSSFVNFSTRDGLLNNRITSLSFSDKRLWIGHQGGVSMISKGKVIRKWPFAEEENNLNVGVIQAFRNEHVVATNGNGLYVIGKDNSMRNIHLKSNNADRIRGLAVADRILYVATRDGLYKTTDLVRFEPVKGTEGHNFSGLARNGSRLVLTTFDRKVKDEDPEPTIPGAFYSFDLQTQQFTQLATVALGTVIRNCIVDTQKGNIWAPSYNGMYMLDPQGRMRSIDQSKGLPLNKLSTIFEDRNGTIWVGSEGKGLFRFPGEQIKYFSRNENSTTSIQTDLVVSAMEISPNRYYFGSYDNKGLMEYVLGSKFIPREVPGILWALEKDRSGNVWIATDDGLMSYQPGSGKTQTYRTPEGTPGDKITTFYREGSELWIGGSDGLSKIVNGKITRVKGSESQSIDVGTIRNIVRYKKSLYCAADGGVFIFVNGRYRQVKGLPKKAVALDTDPYGNLWIGTEEGFFWSDGVNIQQIFFSNQTASSFINFINVDASRDKVYVGTGNGLYVLSHLNFKDKAAYRRYGLEEGLISLESNINSGFIDHRGRLWFGTSQGLTVFDPAAEIFDFGKVLPYLNIKSLKLNLQDFNYADYSTRFNAYGIPQNLVLPRSKNNLLIELDGVTLKNSKDLKFQYWMEGMDDSWSPAFSNPQVTLSNIPPGTYNLHIRAVNANGGFSNEYVLFISIAPAFYTTWWFFGLVFLFFVALTILIIQIRVRRERAKSYRENLEFRARLSSLEQQSLNASMNRHFIFNSLNSIQYFINTQDKLSANRYLTNFAKLIRKNLDSSSEDNNMVSLSQEIERLELYLSLESMRFRDRFEYKIEVSDIETESIMVPAMLFQPFVENSIIHGILPVESRKGLISIRIVSKGSYLEVTLEDNGIGIANSLKRKMQDNGDHRSQGMEITSKRIELLKKLSNKDFEMEGPFQIEHSDSSISGTRVILKIPYENLDEEN